MVEISNARYEQLIKAEITLEMIRRVAAMLPAYKVAEEVAVLLDESEVKADAE